MTILFFPLFIEGITKRQTSLSNGCRICIGSSGLFSIRGWYVRLCFSLTYCSIWKCTYHETSGVIEYETKSISNWFLTHRRRLPMCYMYKVFNWLRICFWPQAFLEWTNNLKEWYLKKIVFEMQQFLRNKFENK